ncbi:MAG: DUF5615 family PIN-like protein [Verrucomicrobiota bacterium]
MNFLLDENFPKSVVPFLESAGHAVYDIRGSGDEGMADAPLFLRAQELQAVLLTTDRDFFHTIPHLFETHGGVVVIALRKPGRHAIHAKLEWFLSHVSPDDYANRAFQLRDGTWICHPPLA